ncbi:MAG: phosphoglycerate dehydrogenase [Actinomycetota bacterium]|nr:phosphoglycerate dehydrogenase [Actinomycetota bacterium]
MSFKGKILITEEISRQAIDSLKKDFIVDVKKDLTNNDLVKEIKKYDALVVKNATKVNENVIKEAENLKVIAKAGANIDNIDIKSATRKGIYVINSVSSNIVSAAELAITLIMTCSKKINIVCKSKATKRNIDKIKLKGIELENKILGIVGLGKTGYLVAKKAFAMGMEVYAFDPYVLEDKFWQLNIKRKDNLEDLFKICDFISIHLPKTKETSGIINKKLFECMKDDAIIVSLSKKGIIIEEDLYDAIKQKKIAAAAIDLSETEYLKGSKLSDLEEVILTPHLSGSTLDAQEKAGFEISRQVADILNGMIPGNSVNLPLYNQEIIDESFPFFELCNNLGSIFAQFFDNDLRELEIIYNGKVAQLKTGFLTNVILSKILEIKTDERVNIVNAHMIWEEKKLKVKETKDTKTQDFINLITIKGNSDDYSVILSGTVTGMKNIPRFISIDKFEIDMVPSKHMAFLRYKDIPGQIGKIGTAFGSLGVNIAAMHVGRKVVSGEALMGLNLDCEVNNDMLERFKDLSGFKDIRIINL